MTTPAGRHAIDLPERGPGAPASMGSRVVAFVIDAVLSSLVAALFTAPHLPGNVSLVVFSVQYVLFTAAFGQTAGMRLCGVGLIRVDGARSVGLPRAVMRTVSLVLLVPALIYDRLGRGVHDKLAGTVAVRTRAERASDISGDGASAR
ncbi:MAG: RDD family protein [Mycobacteriales bacterium]